MCSSGPKGLRKIFWLPVTDHCVEKMQSGPQDSPVDDPKSNLNATA